MTTEFVLILGLYAFILLGVFLGDRGPIATFHGSAPRFAAKLERDIAVGKTFTKKSTGTPTIEWRDPKPDSGPQ
ncbi:MAG: hypothetical protein KDD38_03050 [Bdellovibrionales bacterium]|nr:hypothetical protein [Bdellovibrionales bacterium]